VLIPATLEWCENLHLWNQVMKLDLKRMMTPMMRVMRM